MNHVFHVWSGGTRYRETKNSAESFQELLQRHFEVTKIPAQEFHTDFCSSDIIVLRAINRHLVN